MSTDNIQINTGEKRITINGDPDRVIMFNPSDIVFAEKFYKLISDFEEKLKEYQGKSEAVDAVTEVDEQGLPVNLADRIALLREVCEYLREKIDGLFGPETSKKAFGDALNLDMFTQFFEGITPFIQSSRGAKIAKYSPIEKLKSGRAGDKRRK